MSFGDRLAACNSFKDVSDILKKVSPCIGRFGGRQYRYLNEEETVPLKAFVTIFQSLLQRGTLGDSTCVTMHIERLDRLGRDALNGVGCFQRFLTWIRSVFGNIGFHYRKVLNLHYIRVGRSKKTAPVALFHGNRPLDDLKIGFSHSNSMTRMAILKEIFLQFKGRPFSEYIDFLNDLHWPDATSKPRQIKDAITWGLMHFQCMRFGSDELSVNLAKLVLNMGEWATDFYVDALCGVLQTWQKKRVTCFFPKKDWIERFLTKFFALKRQIDGLEVLHFKILRGGFKRSFDPNLVEEFSKVNPNVSVTFHGVDG